MLSHYNRRYFLTGLATGATALGMPSVILAAGTELPKMPDLYSQVPQISGEWNKVRMFFSFSCPFSSKWHAGFMNWGRSLPKSVSFMPTPLMSIVDDESYPSALAFYSVWKVSPERITQFMDKCYEAVQVRRLDPTDFRTYIMAASNAGVNMAAFFPIYRDQTMSSAVEAAGLLAQRYRLKATPSFGISGRYLVSPEGVGGNEQLMYQLLNAMVSKVVHEKA